MKQELRAAAPYDDGYVSYRLGKCNQSRTRRIVLLPLWTMAEPSITTRSTICRRGGDVVASSAAQTGRAIETRKIAATIGFFMGHLLEFLSPRHVRPDSFIFVGGCPIEEMNSQVVDLFRMRTKT
jgi:hypothetical protein